MACGAGLRNRLDGNGREGVFVASDAVLAVAVRAGRGIADACREGPPVDAFYVFMFNFLVAYAACGGNIPVVDLGTGVTRSENGMASVAGGA